MTVFWVKTMAINDDVNVDCQNEEKIINQDDRTEKTIQLPIEVFNNFNL